MNCNYNFSECIIILEMRSFSVLTRLWVCTVPSPLLRPPDVSCARWGSILHQFHRIVPPGNGLLVFKSNFSRFSAPFRTPPFPFPDIRKVCITFRSASRLGFLIFLFNFPYLSQGPVKCSLNKNRIFILLEKIIFGLVLIKYTCL